MSDPVASKPTSPWRFALKYVVPPVITIGLCWLMFTGIDFTGMLDIIRSQCRFGWIAATLAVSILSHILRAMRWGIQLRALNVRTPLFILILSIFGTYAVNLVFPRLGELWRTGYIAARQKAQFTTVFGSMVADRLADTITVLLITAVAFLMASTTLTNYFADTSDTLAKVIHVVTSPRLWPFVALAIALIWLMINRNRSNPFIQKLKKIVIELWRGFAVIGSMPGRGLWLLLTVGVWGCYFVQLWLAFYAFDFTARVVSDYGLPAVLVTFAVSSLSMGVPSNGGIGPWQWAVIFALGVYGVAEAQAAAFANLVLGTQTVLLIVLGVFTFGCIALDKRRRRSQPQSNDQQA